MNFAQRRPGAFNDEELEDDENEILHNEMRRERMRMMLDNNGGVGGDDDPDDMQNMLDFEDVKGPLSVWLKKPEVIKFIIKQFNSFLRNFTDDNNQYVYEEKIHEMCMNNKQSL